MKLCASLLLPLLVLASSEASPSSLAAVEEGLRLFQSSGVWSAMIVSQRKEEIPRRFQGHSLNITLVAVDRSGLESVKHFPQGIIVLLGGGENQDDEWLRKLPEMHKVIFVGSQSTVDRMGMEFAYSLHFVPDSSNSTEDKFQLSSEGGLGAREWNLPSHTEMGGSEEPLPAHWQSWKMPSRSAWTMAARPCQRRLSHTPLIRCQISRVESDTEGTSTTSPPRLQKG